MPGDHILDDPNRPRGGLASSADIKESLTPLLGCRKPDFDIFVAAHAGLGGGAGSDDIEESHKFKSRCRDYGKATGPDDPSIRAPRP